jgi:hypothetical protein
MKDLIVYFQRRPQSRLALVRLLLYIGFTITAKAAFDMDTLYIIAAGLLGVGDLAATSVGNAQTTPVNDPKLGAGKEIPPALRTAAFAVQAFLPGPIGELFEKYGADGLWAMVKAAEAAAKRAPTQAETDANALDGL